MGKINLLEKIALTGTAIAAAAGIGCANKPEYRLVRPETDEYKRVCTLLSLDATEKPKIQLLRKEDGTYLAAVNDKKSTKTQVLNADGTFLTTVITERSRRTADATRNDFIGTRLGEHPQNVALVDGLNAHYSQLTAQMRADGYCIPAQLTEIASNYRIVQAMLKDEKAIEANGWANSQLTNLVRKYKSFETLVKPNDKNGIIRLQINVERDNLKTTGWMSANITASELEVISTEAYSTAVENYGTEDGTYFRSEQANAIIAAIVGKNGYIGEKEKTIDQKILNQSNITACRIRMASPESAKIDIKNLFAASDAVKNAGTEMRNAYKDLATKIIQRIFF